MSTSRAIIVLIAVYLICGCSSLRDWRIQRYVERSRVAALAKIDQEQCKAEGGFIRGVGMFGIPACVKPYPDAGKRCSDSSECQGMCKAPDSAVVGSSSTGSCQAENNEVGCYSEIETGTVIARMCID